MAKRHTLTAALPYTNGPVHIGHLAGVYIPADIYARFLRSKGEDVLFLCGSDEHGVPITLKAKKEGISPQEVVDKYNGIIKKSFADFGITFDIYSRTSNPTHHETASEFFTNLHDKGLFIEEVSQQFYDPTENQFLADRYITGTCPKCHNEKAYGDQCESCGSSLNATDLINPKSALTGEVPHLKETKHWFLPLDKYQDRLEQWILKDHTDWKANVYGQCKSWLDSGLQPRAVTRDLDWGVKVPLKDAEGKVLYVWFDAPIGYISASKEWAKETGKDWEPYWKSKDTNLIHFIGKDNIVFHCIVFPAMLMAHGDFILPENVPANEFLNLEGDKISTSRNWAVWLHEYLEDFPEKQDVLRYALTATAPETKDNDFTWKDFQARNNNELVAVFGNFINRVLVLSKKYFDGKVMPKGALSAEDSAALAQLAEFPAKIEKSLLQYRFREALSEMMNLARLGNKYLADEEPWKVWKTNPARVETVLNVALQIAASLSIVGEPFIPFSAKKLKGMMNLEQLPWSEAGKSDLLPSNHQLGEASLLFEKIEDEEIDKQLKKLEDTKTANDAASAQADPAKENISFDDFTTMDIRVGTILTAEKVAKTKKLLQLTVDTGIDKRTVVSGIAEFFDPKDLIGKQVSILVNLEPRKIKGIESQGMILMAEDATGKLTFVSPMEHINPGGVVR
ncbi:MAG: methionyl-tRNA synthetase [Sphingobacteriales bacterium]|jgi:methionyl-tRNA synthetase